MTIAKRLAALVDGDQWEVADLLLETYPAEQYGDGANGVRSELFAALSDEEDELRREYGVILSITTMRIQRATAIAWPGDVRTSAASFGAHQMLRGPDRFDRMARYVKRNGGRALSERNVRNYRAEDRPTKPPPPWDVAMSAALEKTARHYLLPGNIIIAKGSDWTLAVTIDADARAAVVAALRKLATRIAATA